MTITFTNSGTKIVAVIADNTYTYEKSMCDTTAVASKDVVVFIYNGLIQYELNILTDTITVNGVSSFASVTALQDALLLALTTITQGLVFEQDFSVDQSTDNYTITAGCTFTPNGSTMRLLRTASGNTLTEGLKINKLINFSNYRVVYRLKSRYGSGWDVMPSTYKQADSTSTQYRLITNNGGTKGRVTKYTGEDLGTLVNGVQGKLPTGSSTDVIRVVFEVKDQKRIITFTNETTAGTASYYESADNPSVSACNHGLVIGNFPDYCDLLSIQIYSDEMQSPKFCFVGDSITYYEYFASLSRYGIKYSKFAGTGNRTQEILDSIEDIIANSPENVVLFIGTNDVAGSVLTATIQANYLSIVTQLKAAGINVIHVTPLPRGGLAGITTHRTYILDTYPTDIIIDAYPSFEDYANPGYILSTYSDDTVHPNSVGKLMFSSLMYDKMSALI
jgi:hypothetical protein